MTDNQESTDVLNIIQSLFILFPNYPTSEDNDKFSNVITSHEAYPILIKNLEKILDKLHWNTTCKLFYLLTTLGVDIRSPIMTNLYVKIQKNFKQMDLESLTDFILGLTIDYHITPIVTSRDSFYSWEPQLYIREVGDIELY